MKTRICKECRRAFQTRAGYLSTCDYCVTDELIAEEKDDPNSNYNHLMKIWKALADDWVEKKKGDRELAMKEVWLNRIKTDLSFDWKRYHKLNYYLGIPAFCQLTKEEFDSIKEESK